MTKRTDKGQFAKGHSGNESGKPKGARNKATMAALELLNGESEALSRKAIEMALAGDTAALRLCLDRIAPPIKERPIPRLNLINLNEGMGVLEAYGNIATKLAEGELLPSEAKALCSVLDKYHQHYEVTVLARRIETLEHTLKINC